MNKNLEIIKKALNEIPEGYELVNQCKATYEILNAAENMAKDITSYEIGYDGKCAEIEELNSEINRFKKELEVFKSVVHLCNYCQNQYPTCSAQENIEFGSANGRDNVVSCSAFIKYVDEN